MDGAGCQYQEGRGKRSGAYEIEVKEWRILSGCPSVDGVGEAGVLAFCGSEEVNNRNFSHMWLAQRKLDHESFIDWLDLCRRPQKDTSTIASCSRERQRRHISIAHRPYARL